MRAVERFSTGFERLDKSLKGGIPLNSMILLMGKAGTGKSLFCYHIMNEFLKKGKNCLFIATRDKPERLIKDIEDIGFDISDDIKEKRLIFIDCYSPTAAEEKGKFKIVDILDLNGLFITIQKTLKRLKPPVLFVFDSLTDLLLRNERNSCLKFLKALIGLIKEKGSIGIFILQEDVHDQKTIASIEYLCDGTIRLHVKNKKRMVEIKRMKGVFGSFTFELKHKDGLILKEFFRY